MPNDEDDKVKLLEHAYALADLIRAQGLAIQNRDFEEAAKYAEGIEQLNKGIEAKNQLVHTLLGKTVSLGEYTPGFVVILEQCKRENEENIKKLKICMKEVLNEMQGLNKHKKVFENYMTGKASQACIVDKNV